MAAVAAIRRLSTSCTSRSLLGALRVNGLYMVPEKFVIPSVQTTSKSLVPYQAKCFSISQVKKAAPEIEQAGHDHVVHWTAEKLLTVVMMGTIPVAIIFPSPTVEYVLALILTLHSHWGVEALVVDYIRPSVFGKIIPKVSVAAVYALSFLTLGGLCYFIYTDVGLINAVKLLWKL